MVVAEHKQASVENNENGKCKYNYATVGKGMRKPGRRF